MPSSPPVCDNSLATNYISEIPISGGLTFHHIALICVGCFFAVSLSITVWLMVGHATHYSKPWQQRYIMRILLIIPVYGATCLLISGFYHYYVYFTIITALYEPLCIASYLTLVCHLVAPSIEDLELWLKTKEAKPWIFPINLLYKITGKENGPFRAPRTAMTQFEIIWFCVYQYCAVRFISQIAAVIAQAFGKYCQISLDPHFAHLWCTIIPAISTVVAMHSVIQAHWSVHRKLQKHGIHFKLLCIKLVVFFTFWQGIIFSLATTKAKSKVNPYIGQTDLQVVLQYWLLSFELIIFALMHIKAYPWSEYVIDPKSGEQYQGGFMGWRAFVDVFNIIDVLRSMKRGFRWIFIGRKYRNVGLQPVPSNYSLQNKRAASEEEVALYARYAEAMPRQKTEHGNAQYAELPQGQYPEPAPRPYRETIQGPYPKALQR